MARVLDSRGREVARIRVGSLSGHSGSQEVIDLVNKARLLPVRYPAGVAAQEGRLATRNNNRFFWALRDYLLGFGLLLESQARKDVQEEEKTFSHDN